MTRAYAEGTSVSVEKSRAELDALLAKHGATQRGIMADDDEGRGAVMFVLRERKYRLDIPLPKKADLETPKHWYRMDAAAREQWFRKELEQRSRERWRAVVLLLKAKLELVRLKMSTVEKEFMADLVLPNGRTVGTMIEEQIKGVMSGESPRLLEK